MTPATDLAVPGTTLAPPERDLGALHDLLDAAGPWIERFFSPRIRGARHLRTDAPALVVANHSGGVLAMLEPLILAHAIRSELGEAAMPHVLAHEVLWHTPFASSLRALGAVPASRASAGALFAARGSVLVYPGGDREAFRSFADRDRVVLGDHRGYVRTAIENGVPIVPVVTAGMHSGHVSLTDGHTLAHRLRLTSALRIGVLPVTLGFPFGLGIGLPMPYLPLTSRVRIRVLPPIQFGRRGAAAAADAAYVEACHARVLARMQGALDEAAEERRAERRADLHAWLDFAMDGLDRLTGVRELRAAVPAPVYELVPRAAA